MLLCITISAFALYINMHYVHLDYIICIWIIYYKHHSIWIFITY